MKSRNLLVVFLLIVSLLITGCVSNENLSKKDTDNDSDKNYNIEDYSGINEATNNLVNYINNYGNGDINVSIKESKIGNYSDGDYKNVILISDQKVEITLKFSNSESLIGITVQSPFGEEIPKDYYDIKLSLSNYDYLGISDGGDDFISVLSGVEEGPVVVNGWSIESTLDSSSLHIFSIQKAD